MTTKKIAMSAQYNISDITVMAYLIEDAANANASGPRDASQDGGSSMGDHELLPHEKIKDASAASLKR
jgi:hypothetical protein